MRTQAFLAALAALAALPAPAFAAPAPTPVAQFPEYMMRTVPKRTPENEYQEVK